MPESELEHAIHTTVRYFDVLDLPVTATQVWQWLLVETEAGPRWGGHKHRTLPEVQHALAASFFLRRRLDTEWGYYFLPGRRRLVRQRLKRHRLAQAKWKIARRAARVLAAVPFVRALAGSGSLAADNTKAGSDLDFLVIVAPGRIWTARLFLLAVSQLLGRRRKHWYTQAPDMLCLNHYISQARLALPADVHNTYTAVLYTSLVPVYGAAYVRAFQQANSSWIARHIMPPAAVPAGHVYAISLPAAVAAGKRLAESLLLEPALAGVERLAERFQRYVISRHQAAQAPGRVALSDYELAFHPDTKVPALLARYHQDPGQRPLL